jgi:hypothetical protein
MCRTFLFSSLDNARGRPDRGRVCGLDVLEGQICVMKCSVPLQIQSKITAIWLRTDANYAIEKEGKHAGSAGKRDAVEAVGRRRGVGGRRGARPLNRTVVGTQKTRAPIYSFVSPIFL